MACVTNMAGRLLERASTSNGAGVAYKDVGGFEIAADRFRRTLPGSNLGRAEESRAGGDARSMEALVNRAGVCVAQGQISIKLTCEKPL